MPTFKLQDKKAIEAALKQMKVVEGQAIKDLKLCRRTDVAPAVMATYRQNALDEIARVNALPSLAALNQALPDAKAARAQAQIDDGAARANLFALGVSPDYRRVSAAWVESERVLNEHSTKLTALTDAVQNQEANAKAVCANHQKLVAERDTKIASIATLEGELAALKAQLTIDRAHLKAAELRSRMREHAEAAALVERFGKPEDAPIQRELAREARDRARNDKAAIAKQERKLAANDTNLAARKQELRAVRDREIVRTERARRRNLLQMDRDIAATLAALDAAEASTLEHEREARRARSSGRRRAEMQASQDGALAEEMRHSAAVRDRWREERLQSLSRLWGGGGEDTSQAAAAIEHEIAMLEQESALALAALAQRRQKVQAEAAKDALTCAAAVQAAEERAEASRRREHALQKSLAELESSYPELARQITDASEDRKQAAVAAHRDDKRDAVAAHQQKKAELDTKKAALEADLRDAEAVAHTQAKMAARSGLSPARREARTKEKNATLLKAKTALEQAQKAFPQKKWDQAIEGCKLAAGGKRPTPERFKERIKALEAATVTKTAELEKLRGENADPAVQKAIRAAKTACEEGQKKAAAARDSLALHLATKNRIDTERPQLEVDKARIDADERALQKDLDDTVARGKAAIAAEVGKEAIEDLEALLDQLAVQEEALRAAAARPVIRKTTDAIPSHVVSFNEKHLFEGELKSHYQAGQGQVTELKGCHSTLEFAKMNKNQTVMELLAKQPEDALGFYESRVSRAGASSKDATSFFPDHWDETDIHCAVDCALGGTMVSGCNTNNGFASGSFKVDTGTGNWTTIEMHAYLKDDQKGLQGTPTAPTTPAKFNTVYPRI